MFPLTFNVQPVNSGSASSGTTVPGLPATSLELREYNRRLYEDTEHVPAFLDQQNSFYYPVSEIEVTAITYAPMINGLGYTVQQEVTPVELASSIAAYLAGGWYWFGGILRIDIPKEAFAGQPDTMEVSVNGLALPSKELSWLIPI